MIKVMNISSWLIAILFAGFLLSSQVYGFDAEGNPEPHDFAAVKRSAERGNAYDQTTLGMMYRDGIGVEPDMSLALKWWHQAAEQDDPIAIYSIGYAYDAGEGVPQDFQEALKWYTRGANLGDSWSQTNLASLYFYGLGTDINVSKAIELYTEAANQGDEVAIDFLYEIGETKQEYLDYTTQDANAGNQYAQNELGRMYYTGDIVQIDYAKAFEWFKKSAEQGNSDAEYSLGSMYLNGQGIQADRKEAIQWYQKAAKQGNVLAAQKLNELGVAVKAKAAP